MTDDTLYWLWLADRCGVACKAFPRLVERYESPFDLYRLDEEEIEQLEGIGRSLKERLAQKSLERSYAIRRECAARDIEIIPYSDSRYPARLRTIEDPPVVLYCKGTLPDMNEKLCIGTVGTRRMSEYGKQTSYKISYELASAGAVVVSGMALGIDGVCACGALAAGGLTVAVLGCGLQVVYPKEHKALMEEIVKHGAVISEYPPNANPAAANFPKRNRIISGLCQGVLIVEGAAGSGALITASKALSQGREVFALPGKVNESNSDGPNELIRNGANVALRAEDIAAHYHFLYHDAIRYDAFAAASRDMVPCETAMARYGVTDLCYRGRFDVSDAEDGGTSEKPSKSASARRKAAAKRKAQQAEGSVERPSRENRSDGETDAGSSDDSSQILTGLDPMAQRVFSLMPLERAVSPDAFAAAGIGIGDAITALTLLELNGLVTSLPGGMYIRA